MSNNWSLNGGGLPQRIDRAAHLATEQSASREVLAFYSLILEFQRAIRDDAGQASAQTAGANVALQQALNLENAAATIPALIALVRKHGPANLAEECAQGIGSFATAKLSDTIQWLKEAATPQDASVFLSRVVLEPQAERFADVSESTRGTSAGNRCPICGSLPQLAVIRPEGDGGKRMLLCALCHSEWEFRRVLCPACGELDHEKLPRFTAEGIPALRVEACDTCLTYLKSVDMTIDGLAVPLVDEVAAAPLDLWAAEHGYRKIVPNIMGF